MWTHKDSRIFLDISKVNRSEFKVVDDLQAGFHLVLPRKGKWVWNEDRWLRSIVVDNDGAVISCSWPKFGNYGELLDDTDILKNELDHGVIHHTVKMDGTLCIRDVINGKVNLRTRGTLYGVGATDDEDGKISFGERFHRVASEKYPRLLDPSWIASGQSLLLEYVSSDNVIVERYKEEDLIFLGGTNHSKLSIITWEEMKEIAVDGGLKMIAVKELPRNPLAILEEVKSWKSEGVVIRCNNDQTFVKVKSDWYKANHLLKTSLNYNTVVEFLEQSDIKNEQELEDFLHSFEYDFEIIESAKVLYARCKVAEEIAINLQRKATEMLMEFECGEQLVDPVVRRKTYAKIACAQNPVVKTMMFALYDGNSQQMKNMVRKIIRAEGKV